MATRFFLAVLTFTLAARGSVYDYGRRCAEELGVEVPVIDCLDPAATVLPITRGGHPVTTMVESCDRPALLSAEKACIPGARIRKWLLKNARGETVTTIVFCRRTRAAAARLTPRQLLTHPAFNDVGLILYNETSHRTCWFFMEDATGKGSRAIPRPYSASWAGGPSHPESRAAEAYWMPTETTAGGRCIKCHDSGPWLRSPFVAQAKRTANAVPPNPRVETHHVEVGALFRDWNGRDAPYRIRVDGNRYRGLLSDWASYDQQLKAKRIAPLDTCTRCHNLGKSRQAGYQGLGTCGYIFDGATGGASSRQYGAAPWMPPGHGLDPATWNGYYRYALQAARGCCANPELRDRQGAPVCYPE